MPNLAHICLNFGVFNIEKNQSLSSPLWEYTLQLVGNVDGTVF